MAWFGDGFQDTPVYDRYSLAQGETVFGPAIVEEHEATTVIGPADHLTVGGRRHVADSCRHPSPGSGSYHAEHGSGRSLRPDRGRSGLAGNHVEPAGHDRRGDVVRDLPHRLQPDRLRGAGFRLRPAGCAGGIAGALARAPCRLSISPCRGR